MLALTNFPPAYQEKLNSLSKVIDQLTQERTAWLDSITAECSVFSVGDEIFDLDKMEFLGVVEAIERDPGYASDGDMDTKFKITVTVLIPERPLCKTMSMTSSILSTIVLSSCFDSDLNSHRFGKREDYIAAREKELRVLKGGDSRGHVLEVISVTPPTFITATDNAAHFGKLWSTCIESQTHTVSGLQSFVNLEHCRVELAVATCDDKLYGMLSAQEVETTAERFIEDPSFLLFIWNKCPRGTESHWYILDRLQGVEIQREGMHGANPGVFITLICRMRCDLRYAVL